MTPANQFLGEIEWQKWQSSHKLFALLDCAHLTNSDRKLFQSLDASLCVGLFEGTQDDGLDSVEPLLLDALNISTSNGISWLIHHEIASPSLLWVVSTLPIAKFARHLRSLLSADLPGAPDALLRFYDPRVFHKLMHVLSEDQKALFFANAQQWWVWHKPSAKRQTYIASTSSAMSVEKISLSALQMQTLNEMDLDDFVQNTQADMVHSKKDRPHTQNLSDADIKRYVDEHIKKALAFGFETEEAVVEYLQHVAVSLGWAYEEKNLGGVLSTLQDEGLNEDEKLAFLKDACATNLIHKTSAK
jgi:Domain of unknown function (DUF4123)